MASFVSSLRAAAGQSTLRILASLVVGLILGAALAEAWFLENILAVAEPVGGLWLDALRMTIVPLVFSLLVVGIASAAGTAAAGGTAAKSLAFFALFLVLSSSFCAVALSAVLAAWPAPVEAVAGLREAAG